MQHFTNSMLSFIKFCMDTDKCICFYSLEVQTLVTAIEFAFRFADSKIYISAGADLSRGIKMATENYTNMVEDHLSNNKFRKIRKIPKQLTYFKGSIARTFSPDSGYSLPGMSPQKASSTTHTLWVLALPDHRLSALTLQERQLWNVELSWREWTGWQLWVPDWVPWKVLRVCNEQQFSQGSSTSFWSKPPSTLPQISQHDSYPQRQWHHFLQLQWLWTHCSYLQKNVKD